MYHCVLQVYRSGTTFLHRHSSWNNSSAIDFYNRRFVSAIHSATSGFCLFEYFTSNFKKQVNTCFTLFIYIHIFYCRGRRTYFKNQQSWCSFFWKISGFSYRISNFHLEFFLKAISQNICTGFSILKMHLAYADHINSMLTIVL